MKQLIRFACLGALMLSTVALTPREVLAALGDSPSEAAISAKQIQIMLPAAPSGIYWIDPDGTAGGIAAFQTYCDMATSG